MQKFTIFLFFVIFINILSFISFGQTNSYYNSKTNGNSIKQHSIKPKIVASVKKNKFPGKIINNYSIKKYDELLVYDNALVSFSDTFLYLYSKDLKINWQANLVTDNFRKLYVEFDTIYSINKNNFLTTFSVNSGLKNINESIKLDAYVLKYPFLLSRLNNDYTMIDLDSNENLWNKNIECKQTLIFSSAKISGCLRKNTLKIYDTITGKKIINIKNSKFNSSSYISSTNSFAFFKSKKNKIFKVDLQSYKISETNYFMKNKNFILRQKELIQLIDDNKIQCVDLISKKLKWEKKFKATIQDIITNQNFLLVRLPSKNITIINNYSGENFLSFKSAEELGQIDKFYSFKDHLYLINDELKNITIIK